MTYLFVGSHPDFLASGRPITFGDTVDAAELDQTDARLAPLLVEQPGTQTAPAVLQPQVTPEAQPATTTTEAT